jgi:hypothetical protein
MHCSGTGLAVVGVIPSYCLHLLSILESSMNIRSLVVIRCVFHRLHTFVFLLLMKPQRCELSWGFLRKDEYSRYKKERMTSTFYAFMVRNVDINHYHHYEQISQDVSVRKRRMGIRYSTFKVKFLEIYTRQTSRLIGKQNKKHNVTWSTIWEREKWAVDALDLDVFSRVLKTMMWLSKVWTYELR